MSRFMQKYLSGLGSSSKKDSSSTAPAIDRTSMARASKGELETSYI